MTKRATARGRGRAPRPQTAYEKRIARFLAAHPGATRQQARGHKPREHIERRERELAAGITTYQRSMVRRWALEQAERNPRISDPEEMVRRLQRWTTHHGYERFRQVRAFQQGLKQTKRQRLRKRIRVEGKVIRIEAGPADSSGPTIAKMADRFEQADLPELPDDDEGWHWFYYH